MSQKKCTSDLEPEGLEEVLKYAGPGKGGGGWVTWPMLRYILKTIALIPSSENEVMFTDDLLDK